MDKLIESITKLEATSNISNDMKPFQILKQYLENNISYSMAMKELDQDSGAYKNLVQSIIKKHRRIKK